MMKSERGTGYTFYWVVKEGSSEEMPLNQREDGKRNMPHKDLGDESSRLRESMDKLLRKE